MKFLKRKLLILGIVMLAIAYLAASSSDNLVNGAEDSIFTWYGDNTSILTSNQTLYYGGESAYEFDGITDYTVITDINRIGNQLTISAWIKPDGSQDNWAKIISRRNSQDDDYLYHISYDKNQRLSFIIKNDTGGDGNIILRNGSFHNETGWYHLVGTYNGSQTRFYIDSVLQGTNSLTGSIGISTAPISIGARVGDYGGTNFFGGMVDKVQLWNISLTSEQVIALYNRTKLVSNNLTVLIINATQNLTLTNETNLRAENVTYIESNATNNESGKDLVPVPLNLTEGDILFTVPLVNYINKTVPTQDFSLENKTISEVSVEDSSSIDLEQPAPLLENETESAETITYQIPSLETNVTSEFSAENYSSIDLEQPAPLLENETESAENITYFENETLVEEPAAPPSFWDNLIIKPPEVPGTTVELNDTIEIDPVQETNITPTQEPDVPQINLTRTYKLDNIPRVILNQTKEPEANITEINFTQPEQEISVTIKDSKGRKLKAKINKVKRQKSKFVVSSAEEHDVEVEPEQGPVKKIHFKKVKGNLELGLDDVPEDIPAPHGKWKQVYAIDPEQIDFEDAVVTVTAKGTELYKCKDWNFEAQRCDGTWVFLQSITPGEEYTFILTPDDPGLAETAYNGTFFEGWESNSFATNNWSTYGGATNDWAITTFSGPYEGTYHTRAEDTDAESTLTTNISTVGYENIIFAFYYEIDNLDTGNYFYAEWYNGTDWILLVNVTSTAGNQDTPYNLSNNTLGTDADNNADFRIRFRCLTVANGEMCKTDNINVTGTPDITPPSSVTNLNNQSADITWIYWNWTNPSNYDFSQAIVYIDGVWKQNTSNNYYNATGLTQNTNYTITVHTKDYADNVNNTDVNSTAWTNLAPTHTAPVLNSTLGTNETTENLTCYNQSTSDPEGDSVKNIFNWYKNNASLAVLNMPFEGGSNSTYTKDYSGHGNDGTVNGATWSSTGGYDGNGAYEFDGSNYISIGQPPELNFTGLDNFTITAWVNVAGGTGHRPIVEKGDRQYTLKIFTNNKFETCAYDGAAWNCTYSILPYTEGVWYHLTARFENGNVSLWQNGIYQNSTSYPGIVDTGGVDVEIGRDAYNPTRFFNGTIDNVQIYNVSLSAEQIQALYQNKTNTIVSQETSLGDIWRCDITPNDGNQDGTTRQSNNLTIIDITPPNSVTNLANPFKNITWIYWNWTEPSDSDFNESIIYIDGVWKTNTSNNFYNATGLSLNTNYTITVHTKDLTGNVNDTDVNSTAWTNLAPTHTTPILNSTFGTNLTSENLTCYNQSTFDLDGDSVKNIFNWYKDNVSITVLNMPFEGGSNSTWAKDYSPYGNEGNVTGATWNSSGGYDGKGAYEFDDSAGDRINIAHSASTTFSQPFSVSLWTKAYNYDDWDTIIVKSTTSSWSNGWGLFWDPGVVKFYIHGYNANFASSSITQTQWNHIVGVYNGTAVRIFVNAVEGTPDTSLTGSGLDISAPIRIGSHDGSYAMGGTIDDIFIFNRSLSTEEVTALYQNKTDLIVSQETSPGEIWRCDITPNDAYQDGTTLSSNNLTIRENVPPAINFTSPTTASGNYSQIFILANVTASDNYVLSTITIYLFNSTGLVNSTNSTSSPFFLNFSSLPDGTYYLNATAIDTFGNINSTETRTIVLDTIPPNSVTNLLNQSQDFTWIYWNWTNPTSDFSQAIIYIDGVWKQNTSNNFYNATGLTGDTNYTITVHTKDLVGNVNNTDVNSTARTMDNVPPASVTNLDNQSLSRNWIYWNWTNPSNYDFSQSIIYIDGVWKQNTSNNYYNATGLSSNTNYTITVHTKDDDGNVNSTDVNDTAQTLIDDIPTVTLDKPDDNYLNDSGQYISVTFNASATDDYNLVNCSLWHNVTGTWQLNQSQNVTGTANNTQFTLTQLTDTTFVWNIECYDDAPQSAFASANRTVILNWTDYEPVITLDKPDDNYINYTSRYVNLTFNASATDDYQLVNCSLWHNISGTWQLNQSENITGTANNTEFTLNNLNNVTFVWNIGCYDNGSSLAFASNRTAFLNWTPPTITSITDAPDPVDYGNNITITADISAPLGISSALVSIDGTNYTMSDIISTTVTINITDSTGDCTFVASSTASQANNSDNQRSLIGGDTCGWNLDNLSIAGFQSFTNISVYVEHVGEVGIAASAQTLLVGNSTTNDVYGQTALSDFEGSENALENSQGSAVTGEGTDTYYSSLPSTLAQFNDMAIRITNIDSNDAVGVDHIYLNVTYTYQSSNLRTFSFNTSLSSLGPHSYTVYANDTYGTSATHQTGTFIVADVIPPQVTINAPVDNYNLTTTESINFNWSVTDDFDANLVCNLTINGTVNATGIASPNGTSTNYTVTTFNPGTHYWNVTCWDDYNNLGASETRNFTVTDIPPSSVTNLTNQSRASRWIYWNWTNPTESDFSQVIIYLSGVNVLNTSDNFYNATLLIQNTSYTLTVHTIDTAGNINNTDVNSTAWTLPNSLPTHTTPLLTSQFWANSSRENLTCYNQNTADADGESVKNIFNWYKDGSSIIELNMPFEGNLTAEGGTKERDYALGNNGTVSGATWNATGGYDGKGAYRFDGSDDYINLSDKFESLTEGTIVFWINPADTASAQAIFGKDDNFEARISTAGKIEADLGGFKTLASSVVIDPNTWYHVVITWDSTSQELFIDLTSESTGPGFTPTDTSYPFMIGRGGESGATLNGVIDDFMIYNYVLNPVQINALYNNRTDVIVLNETSINDIWQCEVTPNDGFDDGTSLKSNTLLINPGHPPFHTPPILNSTFARNFTTENLTCYNQSTWDVEGDPIKNIFNWYRNGTSITVLNMPFEAMWNSTNTEDNWTRDYSSSDNKPLNVSATWNRTTGYDGFGAYHFDGTGHIEVEDSSSLNLTGEITVTAWVKLDHNDIEQRIVGRQDNVSGGYKLGIYTDGKLEFEIRNSSNTITSDRGVGGGTVLQTNTWYHVAGVYSDSGDYVKTYVNGQLSRTLTTTTALNGSTGSLFIGQEPYNSLYFFNGTIDDLSIYSDALTPQQIKVLYENRTDLILTQETKMNETWHCTITPNDNYQDGVALSSNNLTVRNPPPRINLNITVPTLPLIYDNVYIHTNITDDDPNEDIVWVNFTITAPNGTAIINNQNGINAGDIWNSSAFYVDSTGTWLWSLTAYDGLLTTTSSGSFVIVIWQVIVGNITGKIVLADSSGTRVLDWDVTNLSDSNIFIADSDSTLSFNDLKAFSRNISGTYFNNDFEEIDTLLNMTNFTDSVNRTYTANGNPKSTSSFNIFSTAINNVPVINSTNSSNFLTGILWDSSDDVTNGQYDQSDKEDVVFITQVNPSTQGKHGFYDYEITIPAALRRYMTDNKITVSLYTEIK